MNLARLVFHNLGRGKPNSLNFDSFAALSRDKNTIIHFFGFHYYLYIFLYNNKTTNKANKI
jgi:hypothetical protein